MLDIFDQFFPAVFSCWIIYTFPIIFIYKRLNFYYSFWIFSNFLWSNASVAAYWKHLLSFLLMRFIVAFLFFFYLITSSALSWIMNCMLSLFKCIARPFKRFLNIICNWIFFQVSSKSRWRLSPVCSLHG